MKNPMPTTYRKVRAFGFKSVFATLVVAGWLAIAPASAQINNISQVDQRIVAAYGTDYVNRLVSEAPHRLEYLNFYVDNAYYVHHHPAKPGGGLPYVSEVAKNTKNTPANQIAAPDPNNLAAFNPLLYHFETAQSQRKVYLIDGTDKALIFYSISELAERYNAIKFPKQ